MAPSGSAFEGFKDIYRAPITGAADFLDSLGELPADIGLTDEEMWNVEPWTDRPTTTLGQFGAGITQFIIPFAAIKKGTTWGSKLSKASTIAKDFDKSEDVLKTLARSRKRQVAETAGIGMAADFVAFSGHDKNLTALLREHAELNDPITELLASDADDPAVLNRFRNSIEGLGLGIAADSIIKMLSKGVKSGVAKTGEFVVWELN